MTGNPAKRLKSLVFALLLVSSPAAAEDFTVVEFFTSQSCRECPAADAYFAEIAERPGVIALAYHVDYHDRALTFSGDWKDLYSKPEWTERQKAYSGLIMGAGNPETPQFVVDGTYAIPGKKQDKLEAVLTTIGENPRPKYTLTQRDGGNGSRVVELDGYPAGKPLNVFLARYIDSAEVNVTSGPNKGKTILNRKIVQSLTKIGLWYGGRMDFHYPYNSAGAGEGCAIFLQDKVDQRIWGGAPCLR